MVDVATGEIIDPVNYDVDYIAGRITIFNIVDSYFPFDDGVTPGIDVEVTYTLRVSQTPFEYTTDIASINGSLSLLEGVTGFRPAITTKTRPSNPARSPATASRSHGNLDPPGCPLQPAPLRSRIRHLRIGAEPVQLPRCGMVLRSPFPAQYSATPGQEPSGHV